MTGAITRPGDPLSWRALEFVVRWLVWCAGYVRGYFTRAPVAAPAPTEQRPLQWVVDETRPQGWAENATVFGVPLAEANEAELRALVYDLGGLLQTQQMQAVAREAIAPPAPDPEPLAVKQRRAANAWRN